MLLEEVPTKALRPAVVCAHVAKLPKLGDFLVSVRRTICGVNALERVPKTGTGGVLYFTLSMFILNFRLNTKKTEPRKIVVFYNHQNGRY